MTISKLFRFAQFPHNLAVVAFLVAVSVVGIHAAKAQASFPININPGAYTGHYFLISGGLTEYRGSQTVQLAPWVGRLNGRLDRSGCERAFDFDGRVNALQLFIMERCGHVPQLEKAGRVQHRLMKFLRSLRIRQIDSASNNKMGLSRQRLTKLHYGHSSTPR